MANYRDNVTLNLTTILLIGIGCIGVPVWWDLIKKYKKTKSLSIRKAWARFELHTKLVLSVTVVLIVVGAVLIFALEYNNLTTMGDMTILNKMLASLFQSVTTRTAGCYQIP